jgi:DNA modification methylase
LVAAEILDRRWIGIELSPNYTEVARKRVSTFKLEKQQLNLEFERG